MKRVELLQDSPEWHAWRKGGIGASEIAAVIGECPWNTAYDIWLVKTGRIEGFQGNSFTEHGKEMEAKARARYELLHMIDMQPACATHPKFPMCIVSLDGYNNDSGLKLLEIKCPKGLSTMESALAGLVPPNYLHQVQYQMAVTGADLLHFWVFHEESRQEALVEVQPDIKHQGYLINEAQKFWKDHVLANIPPELTEKDALFIEDNPEVEGLCANILELHEDSKPNKKKIDELKALAIDIADHPKIRCGRVRIATVLRNGKFSYHKLTVAPQPQQGGAA